MRRLLILLLVCSCNAYTHDEVEPLSTEEVCRAKAGYVIHVMTHRKSTSQQEALEQLEYFWTTELDALMKYATYVDMQRITRESYQTKTKGDFRIPDDLTNVRMFATIERAKCIQNEL